MKAPLRTTSSSTIEKLRVWLAAELEPLEINNNIQYAHHVVTIFLNDADVEDEPLSPPDDYLRELDNLRAGKSLDQKKRAAVQFLQGVIPFENQPIPCLIEQLIEELVKRVDATKVKTPKKPLGPSNVNIEASRRHFGTKKSRMEQESFEEAFPSLPAETKVNSVTVTVKKGACADGWTKSTNGNESNQRSRRRSAAARRITFVDKSEDAVCVKTGLLHLIPVTDKHLPSPVTIQIDESSLENGIFSGGALRRQYESEWKSAFTKVLPTAKLYSPQKIRFPLPQHVLSPVRPSSWPKVTIIRNDLADQPTGIPRLADKVDLLDKTSPKAFLHIEQRAPEMPPNPLFALDADDLEVSNAISWSQINQEQMRRRKNELSQAKKQENAVVRLSRKDNNDRNRQRNASQASSIPPSEHRSDGPQHPSPLLGAVGGCEVRTNDLVSFAMTQMAQFERNHSGTDELSNGFPDGNAEDPFDTVSSDQEQNALDIQIERGNDFDDGWDSALCPGEGERDGSSLPSESAMRALHRYGWADTVGSPSGWLEPACVWRIAARPSLTMLQWRRTPGCAEPDGTEGCRVSQGMDENNSLDASDLTEVYANRTENTDRVLLEEKTNFTSHGAVGPTGQNWDGWGDPIPIPGSSWDSMIRRDMYRLSTPNRTIDVLPTVDNRSIYSPPELSSCVDNNVSQILQSAFVNSMFAHEVPSDPVAQILRSHTVVNCSELEQRLFDRSEENLPAACQSRLNVIRGRTCSNWLEGVCNLGVECPFSHPRCYYDKNLTQLFCHCDIRKRHVPLTPYHPVYNVDLSENAIL